MEAVGIAEPASPEIIEVLRRAQSRQTLPGERTSSPTLGLLGSAGTMHSRRSRNKSTLISVRPLRPVISRIRSVPPMSLFHHKYWICREPSPTVIISVPNVNADTNKRQFALFFYDDQNTIKSPPATGELTWENKMEIFYTAPQGRNKMDVGTWDDATKTIVFASGSQWFPIYDDTYGNKIGLQLLPRPRL